MAAVMDAGIDLIQLSRSAVVCSGTVTTQDDGSLTASQRVAAGDRYAISDWLVEVITQLEVVRDDLAEWLAAGDREAVAVLRRMQETSATDRGRMERQRSRMTGPRAEAHGQGDGSEDACSV